MLSGHMKILSNGRRNKLMKKAENRKHYSYIQITIRIIYGHMKILSNGRKNTLMKKTDVVIIGAGPAGLSAAIECRKHDVDVIVVDEFPKPGGRMLGQLHQEP